MISSNAVRYCCEDISLIENYDKALADENEVWLCHHRLGLILGLSAEELDDMGLYYNRPASELMFLTAGEHSRIHNEGSTLPEEVKNKIRNALKGHKISDETRKKMSESKQGEKNNMFGKHHTEESNRKNSEAHKGKKMLEDTKKKLSIANSGENNAMYGKHHTEEAKKKLSTASLGKHWYTNGEIAVRAKECPDGFVPGRLKK